MMASKPWISRKSLEICSQRNVMARDDGKKSRRKEKYRKRKKKDRDIEITEKCKQH